MTSQLTAGGIVILYLKLETVECQFLFMVGDMGDFLILPNKMETTRYRVASIRYENDPRDMWFAEAEFAPRPFEEEE